MADPKWKFQFRDDQCEFIVATMNYVIARADERTGKHQEPFIAFAAERTKERAVEIRDLIKQVTS